MIFFQLIFLAIKLFLISNKRRVKRKMNRAIGKRKYPSPSVKTIRFRVDQILNRKAQETAADKLLEKGLEPYIDKELHTLIGDASDVNPFASKKKIWETVLTTDGDAVRYNEWPIISPLFQYECVVERDSPRMEDYFSMEGGDSDDENGVNGRLNINNRYVCKTSMKYEPLEAEDYVFEYITKILGLSNDTLEMFQHTIERVEVITRDFLKRLLITESLLNNEEETELAKCEEVKRYLLHEEYQFMERLYGVDIVRKKILKKPWHSVCDVVSSIRYTPYVWCFRDHNCSQFEIINSSPEKEDIPTHILNRDKVKKLKIQFRFLRELVPDDLEKLGVWNQVPEAQQMAFTIYNKLLKPAYFSEMGKLRWSRTYKRMMINGEGHTFLTREQVTKGIFGDHYTQHHSMTNLKNAITWLKNIGAVTVMPNDISKLSSDGKLNPTLPSPDDRLLLSYVHRWQIQLVSSLVKIHMNNEEERLPLTGKTEPRMKTLSEEQKKALQHCLKHPVTYITGPGGVGKTAVMRELAHFIKKRNILFCAPTGTAACVLSDRVGDNAFTIHSILYRLNQIRKGKFQHKKVENGGQTTKHRGNVNSTNMVTSRSNPFAGVLSGSIENRQKKETPEGDEELTEAEQFLVDCKNEMAKSSSVSIFEKLKDVRVVVVDEGSMVALRLIFMLLNALLRGGSRVVRLVILGDVNQMQSIQGGDVFAQLIKGYEMDPEEKGAVNRLTKCFRTASETIFRNAMKICGVDKGELVMDSSFRIYECLNDGCTGKEDTIRNHMKDVLASSYYGFYDTEILVARRASAELVNAICFTHHCKKMGFESDLYPEDMSLPWKGTTTIKHNQMKHTQHRMLRLWLGTRIFPKKNYALFHWMNARPMQIKHYVDRNVSTGHFVPPPWEEDEPIKHQKDRNGIVMRSSEIVRFICCVSLDGSNEKVALPITKKTPLNNATVAPGYCGTIHYVQGSEHRCVVIFAFGVETEFHWQYLYTAVTRAIETVIIITDSKETIERIRKRQPTQRMTMLSHFVREGLNLFRSIKIRDKQATLTSLQRLTAGRKDVVPGYMKSLLQRFSGQ